MGITLRRFAALGATALMASAAVVVGFGGNGGAESVPVATGQLKITKVLVNSTSTQVFQISWSCSDGSQGAAPLVGGATYGTTLPAGITCTVAEAPTPGFSTVIAPSSVTIEAGGVHFVTVTNTFTPPPPPPPTFSPRTRGYWSNWNTCGTNGNQATSTSGNVLLDAMLPISLGTYAVKTCTPAVAVFGAGSGRFMENQLAAQLLAAEANVKAGASSCITGTIASADAVLASINYAGPPSSVIGSNHPQRAAATALKDALDRYNNGLGCA